MPKLILLLLTFSRIAAAQAETATEIQLLREEIRKQQAALASLLLRLEAIESKPVPAAATRPLPTETKAELAPAALAERDGVGDLNAAQVRAGDFPGAILLPGRDVSFGINGFVKTLAYYDTKAEGRNVIFLPALLGAARDDRNGTASINAELSRVSFDARARLGTSRFRAYVEYDFAGNVFNWRHGYLSWDDRWGQILAGKYWSNFMDLQGLPEGLSEPTLSGAIFARQAQLRYSRPLTKALNWAVSVEDPASSDITAAAPIKTRTAFPDVNTTLTFNGERSHLRLGGLIRRITVDPDGRDNFSATGWGVSLGGHVDLGARDKLAVSGVVGKGLGRYLLGILPTGGAFVEETTSTIIARNSFGAVSTVRHRWNNPCRSTVGVGYASVQTDARQPDTALRATIYGMANYMCSVNRFMTIGGEYNYGRRWNKSGGQDNNRFLVGMQLF